VRGVIEAAPDAALVNMKPSSPYWSLPMSFEHERIHIETSSVLLREMPMDEVSYSTVYIHWQYTCKRATEVYS
jgi:hypothetical protein